MGTAKKLVVGKRPDWLSFNGGVTYLLDYLRQRLGKLQIPDLSDYLTQYFRQSKRRRFESMNSYIVRKVEIYSRARQALSRVQAHYGQARTASRPWSTNWSNSGSSGYGWRRNYDTEGSYGTNSQEGDGGQDDDEQYHEAQGQPSDWGSQWWNYNWSYRNQWGHGQWQYHQSDDAAWAESTPELLPDFLQGWYFLDAKEKNLVQTAVRGDFSLDRIAQELRSQFPEVELQARDQQQKSSSFWAEDALSLSDDEHYDGEVNVTTLSQEGMNEEGLALMTEAEVKAEEAWTTLHAKRTLKDARARQHQVRMNRKYYKFEPEKMRSTTTKVTWQTPGIKCFKCGGNHKVAQCPDRQAPSKGEAMQAATEDAPFVCFSQEEGANAMALSTDDLMSTSEATKLGYGIIDGGATKTLASVAALESLMQQKEEKHHDGRILSVNTEDQPVFGFGNSTKDRCISTTTVGIKANDKNGHLTIHALDKGDGPILLSIVTLRALGAIIDFQNDMMVLRHLDATEVIPLTRSSSGHQMVSLTDDLYSKALQCTAAVPSLKDFCKPEI
eukprot:s2868_g7.t1